MVSPLCGSSSKLVRQLRRPILTRWALAVFILLNIGCASNEPDRDDNDSEPLPANPVSIVFVDIPDIANNVSRQWSARRGGETNVKNISVDELFDDNYASIVGQDIIVYPSYLLGQLIADEKITELSTEVWSSKQYNNRGLLRDGRSYQVKLNDKIWGCPMGSPNYYLICRTEALENRQLEPPADWPAMLEFAKALKRNGDIVADDGKTIAAKILAPLAKDYAAHTFLSFAAPSVRHRGKIDFVFERDSMKPLIDSPPFVQALQQLKEIVGTTEQRLTPEQVFQLYLSNQAAIVIGWPAKAFIDDLESFDLEKLSESTTLARMPGSKRWFDFTNGTWQTDEEIQQVENVGFAGYQASMLTSANYPTTAYEFLTWFGDKKTCATVMSGSIFGAPSREVHLGNVSNWIGDWMSVENSDEFSASILEINAEPVFLMFPRIPGTRQYLGTLADQVALFLAGDGDAKAALENVSEQWESITDQFGRAAQIENLRADFGF